MNINLLVCASKLYPSAKAESVWLFFYFLVFSRSGVEPKSYTTWVLEVVPAVIALFVLFVSYQSCPFTPLVYLLIFLHCVIFMVGGHYTYTEVPLFDHIANWMGSARNNFDNIACLAQDFVPVLGVRETIFRRDIIWGRLLVGFFSV